MNGLYVGRFQPFHNGHLEAVKFCLNNCDFLWIGIGSADKSHMENNPFTWKERREMILNSLTQEQKLRIRVYDIPDITNDIDWVEHVTNIIPPYDTVFTCNENVIKLYEKIRKVIEIPYFERHITSGTSIRKIIFDGQDFTDLVPEGTKLVLERIEAEKRMRSL